MIPTITAANAAHINKEVILRETLTALASVLVLVLFILPPQFSKQESAIRGGNCKSPYN